MKRNTPGDPPRRRAGLMARALSLALATAGLAGLGATTAAPAQAADSFVSDASLTWGLSGYAQKGIFGPWTFKDLSGNVTQLVGSVSGGSQTEYVVSPIPATSMPVSTPQKTPNAVKFTAGTGTADPATDEVSLAWTGSYTVNAYPAMYNAPNEIYSNPQLTLDDDGDGALTMNFALGAGVDMGGNPTEAHDYGRLTVLTFDDGDIASTGADSFRATPNYQGVEITAPEGDTAQVRNCSTDQGATGWWGAWPETFVNTLPSSVRPHFYSTGCGGMQDNKPPLPVDVDLGDVTTPAVTVSDTTLLPNGTQEITVSGAGFDPTKATGTRPPFAGKQSGVYIAFGRYADVWRPSEGAPSSSRTNPSGANGNGAAVKWAVPEASFTGSGQSPTAPAYTILGTDGTFSTTVKVDQSWLSAAAGNYGIYTYAGGGTNVAAFETFTPVTFVKATPTVTVDAEPVALGAPASATVTVVSDGGTTGTVTLSEGDTVLGTEDVTDGTASFDLGSELGGGSHELTADYSGNDNTAAGTGTGTLVVGASVTVSDTTLLPSGVQTVTVTGTGFDPTAAIGTRPPLAGQPAGAYVMFGKFADDWRPSTGAGSGTRKSIQADQQWATPNGVAPGTGAIAADGSFSVTVKVDKEALDAGPAAGFTGNYGIYTYAGSGAVEASFETYTPVTFAKVTPTVTVDAPAAPFGTAKATVTVASEGGATGSVTLVEGETVLATQDLTDGSASFDLGDLAVGEHALTAIFDGNANTEAGTGSGTLVVGKATSAASIAVPARTYGQVSTATVSVTGPGADGAVTLTRGSVVVGTADLVSGSATFSLGKLGAGRHALTATYDGNANAAAATATATATVAKAASRSTVKLTKKPTPRKAGKVQVKVTTSPAGSSAGTVKLVLRNAKGKLVKQVQARLTGQGVAVANLPRLAKGGYRLVVTYAGNGNVKGSTKALPFKVR